MFDSFKITSKIPYNVLDDVDIDINGNKIYNKTSTSIIKPKHIPKVIGTNDTAKTKDPGILFSSPYTSYSRVQKSPAGVEFFTSEYDLKTIANAIQLDGILNRATKIYHEQVLKNSFEIVCPVDRIQQHANKRIREIELRTNIKFSETLSNIVNQLVMYANAYVIKVRKKDSKYGNSYKLFNRTVNPIIGLFVADATTMQIGINSQNKITHYRQVINGVEKTYMADDVIHLTYNKYPGTLTGMSNINQVLDDTRALRKLEEEIEILGFQYAIPLYLYKVGSDKHPAAPSEIDTVHSVINHMPTYGIMCVPHTHSVESVSNNNDPVDIMKFVEHFKSRIFSGLGISPVAMGQSDTSNRNTSEVQDLAMQTITKAYQQIVRNKIEMEFLKELVLDSGSSPERIYLQLRFPEIDLEAQIKKDNNILSKYQGNVITRTEARLAMDMEAKLDETDLYINKVQIPLIEAETQIQTEGQIDVVHEQGKITEKVAKIGAANRASNSVSTKLSGRSKSAGTKAKKTQKAVTNKVKANNRPSNQHGTSSGRPKIKRDFLDSICSDSNINGISLLQNNGYNSKPNRQTYLDRIFPKLKDGITKYIDYTINELNEYYHNTDVINNKDISDVVYNTISLKIKDKINRLENIKKDNSEYKIKYTLNSISDDILSVDKIDNYIKSFIIKNKGNDSILIDSSDCSIHTDNTISVSKITMDNIPPLRYNCKCKIKDKIDV